MKMINVGDTLYCVGEFDVRSRRPTGIRTITSVTVTNVGRKYFYVNERNDIPFSVDSLKYKDKNYSQYNVQLYKSENDIHDMFYMLDSLQHMRRFFYHTWESKRLSKEDIQIIMGVIKPYLQDE